MNSILLSIAAFLILAFGALFAVPYIVNWNEYRETIEEQASIILGRKVNVSGNVQLKLLPSPYVNVTDVHISAPEGSSDSPFLQAKSFTMWLSLPPLLKGIFEAREMEISEPHLTLIINEDGSGNWTGFGQGRAQLPLMPKEISFDRVYIKDAKLDIYQAGSLVPFSIDSLNGTFSAGTLSGPYKFSGIFMLNDVRRDIRFSTGRPDSQGNVRFKSTVNVLSTGSTFNIDGEVNVRGEPEFSGVFTSIFHPPVAQALHPLPTKPDNNQGTEVQSADSLGPTGTIEIKSALKATTTRASFKDMVISIARQSQPQLLQGEAIAEWNKGLNISGSLSARWLDLDQILSGQGSKLDIRQLLSMFSTLLRDSVPVLARASFQTKIEQANIGGDQVSGFDLNIAKNRDKIELVNFAANLPGHNTVNLKGRLETLDEGLGFSGPLDLHGRNFAKLVSWIAPDWGDGADVDSGEYILRGRLKLTPEQIEMDELQGELGRSAFFGTFRNQFKPQGEFVLRIDSDKADLQNFLGAKASISALRELIWPRKPVPKNGDAREQKRTETGGELLTQNHIQPGLLAIFPRRRARVHLRIGHIILQDFEGRDLLVDMEVSNGNLDIKSLYLVSDRGLKIQADGRIASLDRNLNGTVQALLEAPSVNELKVLAKLLNIPASYIGTDSKLQSISPLRLALTLKSGSNGSPGAQLKFDGAAAESQVSMTLKMPEGLEDPFNHPIELMGVIRALNGRDLLAQLSSGQSQTSTQAGVATEGYLQMRSVGIPSQGLDSLFELNAGGVQGAYEGVIRIDTDSMALDGSLRMKATTTASALPHIGLERMTSHGNEPVYLETKIVKQNAVYEFSEIRGTIGRAPLQGEARVDYGQKPVRFEAEATTSEATLPALLSVFVQDQKIGSTEDGGADETEGAAYWSNRAFDTDFFEDVQAKIALKAGRMQFGPDLAINNANVLLTLDSGVLEFQKFTGDLFSGTFSVSLRLKKSRGGVSSRGTANLKNVKFEDIGGSSKEGALASGTADLELSFEGEGLSPRGLASVLSGKGKLSVKKGGEIYRLSPDAIPAVVKKNLEAKSIKTLSDDLAAEFKTGSFPIQPFNAEIDIQNGNIQLRKLDLKADNTTADISAIIEVASLRLDSEWSIASVSPNSKTSIPAVNLTFAGPVTEIGSIVPVIESKSLERYLTVRNMERDMERLEKLELQGRQSLQRVPAKDSLPHKKKAQPNQPATTYSVPKESALEAPVFSDANTVVRSELPPITAKKSSETGTPQKSTGSVPVSESHALQSPGGVLPESTQTAPTIQQGFEENTITNDPNAIQSDQSAAANRKKSRPQRRHDDIHPFYQNF